MSEAQSGVTRNGACPIQDLRDAIGWHIDLSRQFSRAHIECFEFLGEVFTRMEAVSPIAILLMIINNLCVICEICG
jgi:hypothetical protein